MDFALSEQQAATRDRARRIARELLAPGARAREARGAIEDEARRALGAAGLIAPEGAVAAGLAVEEVARGDFNVAFLQVVGSLAVQLLGDGEWAPRIRAGEAIVGIGLSEPHAGSDAGMPRLRARRTRDGWALRGEKSLSLALQADAAIVWARTAPGEERARGISAFLVDLASEGVRRERFADMGSAAVGRGRLVLEDVRVPEDALIGGEGEGFTTVMRGFDFSRALIGLQCLGAAAASVAETWEHVSAREAFDQPLSRFQGVAFPLAEAETLIAAARLLCLRTLWLKDGGEPHTAEAAMCKWWAPQVAFDAIQACLLLHGQAGYTRELAHEQRLRDVLGLQIGDGTAQIMKLVIARQRVGRELAP
ncbi:MAG TPA: acyl-CoA dehydrogenase family protein [Solirubrobacteraceae bacterium]|nr:acyl-CoA dehydrogenase family protein [Solirubrobacteraceae bacterium]